MFKILSMHGLLKLKAMSLYVNVRLYSILICLSFACLDVFILFIYLLFAYQIQYNINYCFKINDSQKNLEYWLL